MKITNYSKLPDAIIKAIENDPYDRGDCDYSITDLLKPPRQMALAKLFHQDIEEDAADMIYRLYGQIAHSLLDRANEADLSEKRFFGEFAGKRISGRIDTLSLKGGILTDWKFSTVYKFKKPEPEPDWVAQLNMQAELLRLNGIHPRALQIVGLIRDHRPKEALAPDYPKSPIVVVNVPMWPSALTKRFIETRIKLHEDAKIHLPECSKAERWAKDEIHAVMKGRRAITGGLKHSHEEALKMHKQNPGTRIEFRPAVNSRCEAYCNVRPWCRQFQKLKGEIERGEI